MDKGRNFEGVQGGQIGEAGAESGYLSSSLYPFGMWTKVQFLGCDGELSF